MMTTAQELKDQQHFRVVIIGAGPAGIGVARGLVKRGVGPVLMLERWDKAGGIPAKYPAKPGGLRTYVSYTRGRVMFGQQFADHLLKGLDRTKVELRLESSVLELNAEQKQLTIVEPIRGKYQVSAEAIVLATGAREETPVERGWIAGDRSRSVFQTMQLLELIGHGKQLSWKQPVVAGSDLVAYAASAKLKMAGASSVRMIDTTRGPQTPLPARVFFSWWVRPEWNREKSMVLAAPEEGSRTQQLQFSDGRQIDCDALIVSGQLVPNVELLTAAGIETKTPAHLPLTGSDGQLSASGCFATGNVLGGFHGGQWCYSRGLRVAKAVDRYLNLIG